MSKKTFVVYYDRYEYCDWMTDKQKANLFECIRTYTGGTSGIQPLPEIQFVRNKIKKTLDQHHLEYEAICKRNKDNADKRRKKKWWPSKVPVVPVASSGYQSMLDTDTDTDNDNGNDIKIGYWETSIVKLTTKEYDKIKYKYSKTTRDTYILKLEEYIINKLNWKDKYNSHYLTILNRCKRDWLQESKYEPL